MDPYAIMSFISAMDFLFSLSSLNSFVVLAFSIFQSATSPVLSSRSSSFLGSLYWFTLLNINISLNGIEAEEKEGKLKEEIKMRERNGDGGEQQYGEPPKG